MKSVKEVLKQDKLPHDHPPTMQDVKTREKHVPESVDYNVRHFKDHGKNVADNLKKLRVVNPRLAKHHASKSVLTVKRILKDLESHL